MSVYRRKETGKWMVDVTYALPNGRTRRVKKSSPVQTRRGAEEFERQIRLSLQKGEYGKVDAASVPTFAEYVDRFIDEWCVAQRHKPSGIESKRSAIRNYLQPIFGNRRLDSFGPRDEDKLRQSMAHLNPATYNNAASCMNTVLKVAVRWSLIDAVGHRFALDKRQKKPPKFYDFDEFDWMTKAARELDARYELLVLLGGHAGLRRGEVIALEWDDIDFRRNQLTVERAEWKGHVREPKGMETRQVPMSARLEASLQRNRHLIGPRVLYSETGRTLTAKVINNWMRRIQLRAKVKATGGYHILRHTFCSHLAMKGAAPRTIQELAGHKDLTTTLNYMHLSPGEKHRAIELLNDSSGPIAAHRPS